MPELPLPGLETIKHTDETMLCFRLAGLHRQRYNRCSLDTWPVGAATVYSVAGPLLDFVEEHDDWLDVSTPEVRLTEHDDTFTRSTDCRVDNTWLDSGWGRYDEQVWHPFEDCRALLPPDAVVIDVSDMSATPGFLAGEPTLRGYHYVNLQPVG